jgi:hypothetical protein
MTMVDIAILTVLLFLAWGIVGFFANGGKLYIKHGYLYARCEVMRDPLNIAISGPIICIFYARHEN